MSSIEQQVKELVAFRQNVRKALGNPDGDSSQVVQLKVDIDTLNRIVEGVDPLLKKLRHILGVDPQFTMEAIAQRAEALMTDLSILSKNQEELIEFVEALRTLTGQGPSVNLDGIALMIRTVYARHDKAIGGVADYRECNEITKLLHSAGYCHPSNVEGLERMIEVLRDTDELARSRRDEIKALQKHMHSLNGAREEAVNLAREAAESAHEKRTVALLRRLRRREEMLVKREAEIRQLKDRAFMRGDR